MSENLKWSTIYELRIRWRLIIFTLLDPCIGRSAILLFLACYAFEVSKCILISSYFIWNRWGYDKFPKETPMVFYLAGQPILPPLGLFDGLKVVLENMVSYIQREIPGKTLKFWRLQSPRHFYGGEWNQNGSCLFNEPLKEYEVWTSWWWQFTLYALPIIMNNDKLTINLHSIPCES